jgi:Pyruvate/2-oxoacid:ferredoxin oxidoreductase delta subunit
MDSAVRIEKGLGRKSVAVNCDQCGRFCGAGSKQYRRHDWQGVPIEDYLLCKTCENSAKVPELLGFRRVSML